ncbi:hypothetical protein QBC34DRAFT_415760 [Podospora aff. communis PSN243]|uniref:mRNA stability protein n=1 Tax=Podospora aff. communis PSN243 TaxID=3040156 RepID=A0AAV9GAJ3_9PEZI|nr:hypothetical protein QBC34DRAFT_415760 [Podospora aff. communis PSN243]
MTNINTNLTNLTKLNTNINTTTAQPTSPTSTSPAEARLLRLYGPIGTPARRFAANLKSERKYFDSGDYALSKAGRGDGVDLGAVGVLHPLPEMIPHPQPVRKQSMSCTGETGAQGQGLTGVQRRKSSLSGFNVV